MIKAEKNERRLPIGPVVRLMRSLPPLKDPRRAGLSQRDLAHLIGAPLRQVARWFEAGSIPMSQADYLACRFGMHPTDARLWPDFQDEPHTAREAREAETFLENP